MLGRRFFGCFRRLRLRIATHRRGDFLASRNGNVLIIVALSALPLMIGVAVSVNVAQIVDTRYRLQMLADAGALAGAKATNDYLAEELDSADQGTASQIASAGVTSSVTSNYQKAGLSTPPAQTVSLTSSGDYSSTVQVTLTTSLPSMMSSLIGSQALDVSASATASMSPGSRYFQIIFVVDVSNSMGVGGTESAIQTLINADQCAFACHDPNSYSSQTTSCTKRGTGWNSCDKRTVAKNQGIQLKIDYVNSAIQLFIQQLQTYSSDERANFTVGIDTFGYSFTTLLSPTTDLTTAATKAQSIDIETVTNWKSSMGPTYNYGYTYTTNSLTTVLNNLTNVGDGSSATSMRTFIVFLSDGLEDTPGSSAWGRATGVPYVSACTALQNTGIRLFTIWTPYYAVLSGSEAGQYAALVAPYAGTGDGSMEGAMQDCASGTNDFFLATDGPSIQNAIQSTFGAIIQDVGLRLIK
ncbi:pilus assembly protein TadG-related protein [Acetobacter conturbans]|uniref:VWFA domain-containing protein n=1 Tax=Acetobacter conturbans TaxID=1737472 RepID=A0ABX0JVH6_9PROT|nr:pilus assembly protein TadG-related protein [Acetobacter conturbans]NHN87503.1 hypothetical protein [Acetobacter conturbans]